MYTYNPAENCIIRLSGCSRSGDLDLNYVSREEAEELVNRSAVLEDQVGFEKKKDSNLYWLFSFLQMSFLGCVDGRLMNVDRL